MARIILLLLLSLGSVRAGVVRMEISERADVEGTDYEEIQGRLFFAIDPKVPSNALIADVELAPANGEGKVEFSADLRILKPKEAAKSNGVAWVEVPNRGGKAALAPWMREQGFTILNVGWEFDVPRDEKMLRLEVPVARNPDGSPIRGVVNARFVMDKPAEEILLTDLAEYPPVDLAGPESRLVARKSLSLPEGEVVSREQWTIEDGRVRLEGGFEPGRCYEIFYVAEAPPIGGLGYAAIRDAVAWLKHDPASPMPVQHTLAFGSSQCGRFLRDFLYHGFNTDERDRQVLDGVLSHIAGAGRLVLNRRWSQPRSPAAFHTASYPFADVALSDPACGQGEGVLENPRVRHRPKLFYINTASEYWGGGRVAALTHVDPEGRRDIDFPDEVRSYFYASTQHGAAPFPPSELAEGAPLTNPVDGSPVTKALRKALYRWVAEGEEPPPSVHPKLVDGTLVAVADFRFPAVPGLASPRAILGGTRLPNQLWKDGIGEGLPLPLLVPQVDGDGNDLGGIRMPEVAVPLATATGWVFRPERFGSPHELVFLRGAWVPFAASRAQREESGDPRPSLEERYSSKEDFLARVEAAARNLVSRRFLLEEDLAAEIREAAARWDWVRALSGSTL